MEVRRISPFLFLVAAFGVGVAGGQELAREAIPNWPAPLFWEPPAAVDATPRTRGSIGTESILATSSSPLPFIAVTPCRIIDTRVFGGEFAAGETRTYVMSGGVLPCVSGFPLLLAAVSLNITVTQTAGTGFVTGFPTGGSLPLVATLTWIGANQTLSNAAVVPTGSSTSINIYTSQATHVILDINGYYAGAGTAPAFANTFLGWSAGNFTMTGDGNTGIGYNALQSNTTGSSNTALGAGALLSNTMGGDNTATGYGALGGNGTGNTAIGRGALGSNMSGSFNTAIGRAALGNSTTGSSNIAIGSSAGGNLTTGSHNIHITSGGTLNESNTIRIGDIQTATYIAGISGVSVVGSLVYVSTSGQLGVGVPSSRRFKRDIADIGDAGERVMKLRPVAFRYKPEFDASGLQQYGLIAEEVAEVYPDLVAYGRDGQPETVRYHLLVPMLLNEVQKDRKTIADLNARLERLEALVSKSVH